MATDEREITEKAELDVQAVETLELEVAEEQESADYSNFTKKDFVELLEKQLAGLRAGQPKPSDFRRTDEILKDVKQFFDQHRTAERAEALQRYLSENESEEGFDWKADELTQQFEQLYRQLRDEKNKYYQGLEKSKEKNFAVKTELIERLRKLVEADEANSTSADKASLNELKKIQDEWKAAGNIASPHNGALWSAYHALVDRFYSNRSIYYELLELDRKKNLAQKIELCERVEKLVAALETTPMAGAMIDEANAIFEEYKQVGPSTRETQEALWQRFKAALDTIYGKRREQLEGQKQVAEENYRLKAEVVELITPFTTFQSGSINEWNDRTKALLALQDQWNAVKGAMPREKGRELSKNFWAHIKTFFQHKNEFFRQLEAKREENLKAKQALIEGVKAIIEASEDTADSTNRVIQFQKDWKAIGHVPEKFKNSIYDDFKKVCDQYFDRKRNRNQEVEKQFEDNLAKKVQLCDAIEAEAKVGESSLERLNAIKAEWSGIGFVPKKEMQNIQKRYIAAINQYVGSMGKLSASEKAQVVLQNEVALMREDRSSGGGRGMDLRGKENDLRRKITTVENDIALWKNNIEFFARSKSTEKLRTDFEKKIEKAERELAGMKQQLKIVREAEG
jgi:hypothetical protein